MPESRKTSYYTYFYKLTGKEAKKIYKKDLWKVDSTFFHTLVDSIPTDSVHEPALTGGHYLKVLTEKNNLKLSITTIPDFDVKIINNNTDLNIQVYDFDGRIIGNAKVMLNHKRLPFDKKTQTYRDKKSNHKGLLKVTHDGFTAYFDLNREYNNSQFKRISKKTAYSTPIKYVWIPVRFVIFIPIDGVRSVINGYTAGSIWHIVNFSRKSYEKIACLFDDYFCGDTYKFTKNHNGYLVFNKPKYHPGDTVKFKAFIVNKKGKPIDEEVQVELNRYGKTKKIALLRPYREGAYEFQFHLHDSLQLILDSELEIALRKNEHKVYRSAYFRYEDYELSSVNLEITTSAYNHYRGKEFALFAKGTNENDLNLLDAAIEVIALSKEPFQFYDNAVFIPDTLFQGKKSLDIKDATKLVISDTLFPKADLSYELIVKLTNSDNDLVTETKKINFFHKRREVDYDLVADSLKLTYRVNDEVVRKPAAIYGIDHFDNKTEIPVSELPVTIAVNPYFSKYLIITDSLEKSISIHEEPALIRCLSERSLDSIHIYISNPRGIAFNYFVYRKNKELTRGYGHSFEYHEKALTAQNYFVSLQYLWGGKIKDENYRIPVNTKELDIDIHQPAIIYPGQKTEIEIEVKDKKGNPVADVDLTAYAFTKKFDAPTPEVPSLDKPKKDKEIINNFRFVNDNRIDYKAFLDYNTWKVLAALDSIEYYKFLYPGNQLYKTSFPAIDSITQFAPYVIYNGYLQTVHVVYVDRQPIYFDWSENSQPYSFLIDSGYHKIELRTRNKQITIDSVYFPFKKKTIFSLNQNMKNSNILIMDFEPKLTAQEKRRLYNYIFPYRNTFDGKFAYIKQGDKVQLLSTGITHKSSFLAGPVQGGGVYFKQIGGFTTWFQHEPMFEYEFQPGLLKMRNVDTETRFPSYLSNWHPKESLDDLVLTEKKIMEKWEKKIEEERLRNVQYSNPLESRQGTGTLVLEYEKIDKKSANPLNILVFKHDDHEFIRVYPGSANKFYSLYGQYKIIYFYPGSHYYIYDSIDILPNGLNYFKLKENPSKLKDDFSRKVNEIIEETIFRSVDGLKNTNPSLRQIQQEHREKFIFGATGEIISGYVYDHDDQSPLPGVNVVVKGTNIGTVTDVEGYFSLKVPEQATSIVFSFIGYVTEVLNPETDDLRKVVLKADVTALQEVIVVGYGMQRKSNLTASIATVNSSAVPGSIDFLSELAGRAAGVTINGAPSIAIRGSGTLNINQNPLIVIDGVVYTGNFSDLKPEFIDKIEVLKDEQATAIYGARAANGVVLITTKGNSFKATGQIAPDAAGMLAGYDGEANTIRNNFSDYGYWQPRLKTDKNGMASFKVTFPDDVTSWNTYVLAMNNKRQSGMREDLVKSYKPLMAQLALPRFMVNGDSINAIGKILNYTHDTLSITTTLEINNSTIFKKERSCASSLIDTLYITDAYEDSLDVRYFLENKAGYFDGEQRKIPVLPLGMRETIGSFYSMNVDTTLSLKFNPHLGEVTIYAQSDILEVLEDEIEHVIKYKYDCNEQLASKLKVLLAQKTIYKYKGKSGQHERKINQLINQLQRNGTGEGLWGWWKNSKYNFWISLHVMEALIEAGHQGFDIKIRKDEVVDYLLWNLSGSSSDVDKVRIIKLLKLLNPEIDYRLFANKIEVNKLSSLNEWLLYLEMKRTCGISVDTDTLSNFSKTTMMGNLYYSDTSTQLNLLNNDIQNTILVYKIFKYDSIKYYDSLARMRQYFLERRNQGYWTNTYESSRIIETILPDILDGKSEISKSRLSISGSLNKEIEHFPFETKLASTDSITISKTGDYPVYLTAHQSYWNRNPETNKAEFVISSSFEDLDDTMNLTAGKEAKLIVDLIVKKDAEYVMVEIPIPAGCSYASKETNFKHEAYREYFKEQTSIFCEFLKAGSYRFEIKLLPRFSGKYNLNPAKAELMYFPVFYGNNQIKKVVIK